MAVTVSAAWKALTDDKDPTNWILLGFDQQRNMHVQAHGQSGLVDLKSHMTDDKAVQVAVLKVVGVDVQQNVTSRRPKYVRLIYVGRHVSALRKGIPLQKKAELDKLMQGTVAELQFSDCEAPPPTMTHLAIGKSLLAAGGAHKPVYYDFGNNEHLSLKKVYENKDWSQGDVVAEKSHEKEKAEPAKHDAPASPVAPASPAAAAPSSPAPAAPTAAAADAPASPPAAAAAADGKKE
jgi:hypothetical protein